MKIKRIIDISRKIKPGMAIWPGDKGISITRESLIKEGGHCNLSSISFGLHTGTHVDAPFHYIDDGKDISSVELSKFIGYAKVFEINANKIISKDDIKDLGIKKDDIVFFKTSNSSISEASPFYEGYIALDVTAAQYLSDVGIKTLGVDYLSIDTYNKGHHDVHMILLSNEIGIIEGLNLKEVTPGTYFFSALPLKIENVDGTPTRAVLIEFENCVEK